MIPRQKISLSLSNLLIIGSAAFLLLLLWQLKGLIIILMIAIVIASTLSPLVKSVENIGVPRWFSVISVYLMLILVLTGIGLLLGPTIVAQLQLLLEKLPLYIQNQTYLTLLINNSIYNQLFLGHSNQVKNY